MKEPTMNTNLRWPVYIGLGTIGDLVSLLPYRVRYFYGVAVSLAILTLTDRYEFHSSVSFTDLLDSIFEQGRIAINPMDKFAVRHGDEQGQHKPKVHCQKGSHQRCGPQA